MHLKLFSLLIVCDVGQLSVCKAMQKADSTCQGFWDCECAVLLCLLPCVISWAYPAWFVRINVLSKIESHTLVHSLKILNNLFIFTFLFYEATNLFIIRANSRKPMPCSDSKLKARASSRFVKPVTNMASALGLNSSNSEKEKSLKSQEALDSPGSMSTYL